MITKLTKYRLTHLPAEKINIAFVNACSDGDLELVRFLLLDQRIINADIKIAGNDGIKRAAAEGHNDIVKFLLEGEELSSHVSIKSNKFSLLKTAVEKYNTDLIDYLLGYKEVNLNQDNDRIFISLMFNFKKSQEIIQSLIVDYQIPRTEAIVDFLDQKNHDIEGKRIVKQWFDKRDDVEILNYVLGEDKKEATMPKPKKKKI